MLLLFRRKFVGAERAIVVSASFSRVAVARGQMTAANRR
jgi:hypothetical protein